MPVHEFTAKLIGVHELTATLLDTLYEAGCDDALVSMRDGEVFVIFDRVAETRELAMRSAVVDFERAGQEFEFVGEPG